MTAQIIHLSDYRDDEIVIKARCVDCATADLLENTEALTRILEQIIGMGDGGDAA